MLAAMTAILQETKADTNSVAAWIDDWGVGLMTTSDTPKDRVFEDYRGWCLRNAMRKVSVVQFWKRMHEHFSQLHEARLRDEGKQHRVCNVAVPE